ncbi:MAG: MBOAT family O-acyltransferase [Bacteroidales bacterium]|jgi:alginate O-acetyltransferase complex protein AlgI|nr:MBOAT family O-acyltransferase [Bacteroidales bacterium]
MVFSSSLFLLYFFPAFLVVYYLLPRVAKNPFALLASILFYAWGAPAFVFVVLGSILLDFYIVKTLDRKKSRVKDWLLAASMALNIGLLLYFKYANFFVDNVNEVLGFLGMDAIHWVRVALPIGISFFTFQKITYAVDVYRKVHAPLKLVSDYALYILMFPQLIAGPIVRYNEIADQLVDRRANENINNRLTGFFRFVIGLSKKVLIANVLGEEVDRIFDLGGGAVDSMTAWYGIIAYGFQIYYDFSGYSDMAIGIGRMIGFRFPENFNNPYISQSISEFWRRWHMTLGRFMKDYLYIPLGGNRVSTRKMYFNLWVVFLISGFWHGASWNFVIWGAFHGLFLIADRIFLLKFYKAIGKVPSIIITYLIVLVGWVFFRAETLPEALAYLESMFSFSGSGADVFFDSKFNTIMLIAVFFSFWGGFRKIEAWQERLFAEKQNNRTISLMVLFSIVFFLISLAAITSSGFNPFIYFRF